MARALESLDRNEEAIIAYKSAIELNPDDMLTYFQIGLTCSKTELDEEAIFYFKKAIELNCLDPELYLNMGNAMRKLGKHPEAIVSYKKAIEIDVSLAEAYINMGNSLEDLGRYEEAMKIYREALILVPGNIGPYNNLIRLINNIHANNSGILDITPNAGERDCFKPKSS